MSSVSATAVGAEGDLAAFVVACVSVNGCFALGLGRGRGREEVASAI